jgi:hypothetical protein
MCLAQGQKPLQASVVDVAQLVELLVVVTAAFGSIFGPFTDRNSPQISTFTFSAFV